MFSLALVMAMALIIIPFTGTTTDIYASAPTVFITVDGRPAVFHVQQPIFVQDRVLVPIRGVFEMMGFTISWDSANRMARMDRPGTVIIVPADMSSFVVNNTIISPSVPQQVLNGRLMLPLRYVAEAVQASAEWDQVNRVAMITTNGQFATPTPQPPTPTPQPPEPTPTPTPDEPTPTPEPEPTPTPEPQEPTPTPEPDEPTPPPPPQATPIFSIRPFTDAPRHNITRSQNVNMQGTVRTGILTRVTGPSEQRDSDSWIEFYVGDLDHTRFTGYVGRTGAAATVPGLEARRLTIYGDGHVLQYFMIDGHTQVTHFDVDIYNVQNIRIHFQPIGANGVSLTAFDLYVR